MAVKVARQMAKGRGVANEQSTERRGYRMVSMKTQAARDRAEKAGRDRCDDDNNGPAT